MEIKQLRGGESPQKGDCNRSCNHAPIPMILKLAKHPAWIRRILVSDARRAVQHIPLSTSLLAQQMVALRPAIAGRKPSEFASSGYHRHAAQIEGAMVHLH